MTFVLNHVSKSFLKGRSVITAVQDVSLPLPNSGLVLLTGAKGCGKSTLLSLIGGLDKPSEGNVTYNNQPFSSLSEKKKAQIRRDEFGYVFDQPKLLEDETIEKNILLSLEGTGIKVEQERMTSLLFALGIDRPDSLLSLRARSLSPEEETIVSIARALIKKPKVLLVDESVDALNQEKRNKVFSYLSSLSNQMLILLVSSYSKEVLPFACRHISMESGRIVSDETLSSVQRSEQKEITKKRKSKLPNFSFSRRLIVPHRVRFIISVIFAFLSITCFGIGLTGQNSNSYRSQLQLMHDNHVTQAVLVGQSALHVPNYPDSYADILTDEQIKTLKEYQGGTELIRVNFENAVYVRDNDRNSEPKTVKFFDFLKNYPLDSSISYSDNPYLKYFDGFLEVDPVSNLLNWAKDSRLKDPTKCHLPKNDTEVALTSFKADMYLEYGYRNEEGIVEELSSVDDLIGKKLDRFTICGIYTPSEPREIVTSHLDDDTVRFDGVSMRQFYVNGSFLNNYAIVYKQAFYRFKKELLPDDPTVQDSTAVLINLPSTVDEGCKLISSLSKEGITKNDAKLAISYYVSLRGPYSALVQSSREYRTGWKKILLFVLAGVLGFLSFLLFWRTWKLGLEEEQDTFSLLYAFGSTRNRLFWILIGASLYWLLLCLVPSLVLAPLLCFLLNRAYQHVFLLFGGQEAAYLILFAFGLVLLATILPLIRFLRQKLNPFAKEAK